MKNLSDKELVERLTCNDEKAIRYFFYEKCKPMLGYIIKEIFSYRVEKNELVNELYIYLQENNWHKLRKFDYRSKLSTWMSVVAVRFFQKKRDELIENGVSSALNIQKENGYDCQEMMIAKMDIATWLEAMPNERYRYVIKALIIEDSEPQQVADKLEITIDNLYNLKRRALQQLMKIINIGEPC